MARKDVSDSEIEILMKPVHASLEKYLVKREPLKEEEHEQARKGKPTKGGKRKSASARKGSSASGQQHNQRAQTGKQGKGNQGKSASKNDDTWPVLTGEQLSYMRSILEHPNMSVTARGEKLFGYSADKRTKLKNGLLELGLIEEFSVDLGKEFGGRVKMLKLTDAGYRALEEPLPESLSPRHSSLEHLWWQVHLANDYAQRGYKANIEKILQGKSADVGVSNGKELVAVEVQLTPQTALSNFRQNTDAGFARTILACKNAKVKKQVEAQLATFLRHNPIYEDKAKVVLLSDFPFVKQLYKEIRG